MEILPMKIISNGIFSTKITSTNHSFNIVLINFVNNLWRMLNQTQNYILNSVIKSEHKSTLNYNGNLCFLLKHLSKYIKIESLLN